MGRLGFSLFWVCLLKTFKIQWITFAIKILMNIEKNPIKIIKDIFLLCYLNDLFVSEIGRLKSNYY